MGRRRAAGAHQLARLRVGETSCSSGLSGTCVSRWVMSLSAKGDSGRLSSAIVEVRAPVCIPCSAPQATEGATHAQKRWRARNAEGLIARIRPPTVRPVAEP